MLFRSPAGPLVITTSYQRYAKDNTCNTTLEVSTGTWTVTVNPLPVPTVSGPTSLCNFTTGNVYTTEAGKSNYVWNVSGGTITAGAGTNAITVTWNNDGAQTVSVNYANTYGCTAVSATVYNVTVKAAPSPVITGSPNDGNIIAFGETVEYCTPLVTGHLYSWTGFGQIIHTSVNCISDQFVNPCGAPNSWTITVFETDPTTHCSAKAIKDVYFH